MPRGIVKDPVRRRAMRTAHTKHSHTCPFCKRTFWGNGYGTHLRSELIKRMPDMKGKSAWDVSDLYQEWLKREKERDLS